MKSHYSIVIEINIKVETSIAVGNSSLKKPEFYL